MTAAQLLTKHGITKVSQLEALLAKASDLYYNTGKTILSDADFDTLLNVLKNKKPTSAFLKQTRAPATGRQKEVVLPYLMPSLDKKHYGTGTLAKWTEKYPGPYLLMDKLDGISIEIIGDNSQWDGLYKGGDERTGMDWSRALPHLKLPRRAPAGHSGFRAETIMSKAEFDKLWSKKYSNARNLTGGIVNKQRGIHEAIGSVRPIVFDVLHKRMKPSAALAYAAKCGFEVVHHKLVRSISEEALLKYLRQREQADHMIDGIVIAQDKAFPITASNPKTMIAFKAPSAGNYAETKITAVEWRATRTGRLFPRFTVAPVKLAGVTVTHATAHAAKYVVDNKINVGTTIGLIRSGEVIPYVDKVIKPSRTASLPDASTVGAYAWDTNHTHFLLKKRGNSSVSSIKAIAHFFATGLDVDGLGVGVIKQLYDNGYTSIEAVARMDAADLTEIEGWGDRKSEKIVSGIQAALENADQIKVMAASGFFAALGERKLKMLYDYAPDLFDMSNKYSIATIMAKAEGAPGFKETSIKPFAEGRESYRMWIRDIPITFKRIVKQRVTGAKCKGHVVCFTGVRNADLEKYIAANGGTVVNSVSAKTTYLLAKDPNGSSAKLNKARDQGIKVMSMDQYARLVKF